MEITAWEEQKIKKYIVISNGDDYCEEIKPGKGEKQ